MTDSNSGEARNPGGQAPDRRWQERLLPFMLRMVVGLAMFFLLASLAQLAYLQSRIWAAPERSFEGTFALLEDKPAASQEQRVATFRAHAALALEARALERRYHQANVQLMARVWMRYLGFLTGMILALVGSAFILGQLRGATSSVEAGSGPARVSVTSASPGIILATLGVALMVATVVARHLVQVTDAAVYMEPWSAPGEQRAGSSDNGSPANGGDPPPLHPRGEQQTGGG